MHPHRHLLLPLSFLLLTAINIQPADALRDAPARADVVEDATGQVTINGDTAGHNSTEDDGANLPIAATIFSGVPGPSTCRGSPILQLTFPDPAATTAATSTSPAGGGGPARARCYDLARTGGCGLFVASRRAGCEARLFSQPGCRVYVNTAVFGPEARAVGGAWRSVGVRCGVPAPDPASLGPPPLAGLMQHRPGRGQPP